MCVNYRIIKIRRGILRDLRESDLTRGVIKDNASWAGITAAVPWSRLIDHLPTMPHCSYNIHYGCPINDTPASFTKIPWLTPRYEDYCVFLPVSGGMQAHDGDENAIAVISLSKRISDHWLDNAR